MSIKLLVCDDHEVIRTGLASLLAGTDIEIVAEASDGKEALKQAIVTLRDDAELRERLGRNALKAAITKHNWQAEQEKLFDLYERIKKNG